MYHRPFLPERIPVRIFEFGIFVFRMFRASNKQIKTETQRNEQTHVPKLSAKGATAASCSRGTGSSTTSSTAPSARHRSEQGVTFFTYKTLKMYGFLIWELKTE